MIRIRLGLMMVLLLITFHALGSNKIHTLITPKCFAKFIQTKPIATHESYLLIQTTLPELNGILVNANAKDCHRFRDVTNTWQLNQITKKLDAHYFLLQQIVNRNDTPTQYKVQYPIEVKQLLKDLNPQNLLDNLTKLSSADDRYANSKNGEAAALWFKTQIENFARINNRNDVTISIVPTLDYLQPSIVVKLGNSNEPGVVISAHMDTLSSWFSKKPGADDDGSGSITVLETARVLMSSDLQFKNPIYFMWYAAEEEGLLGSDAVVADFKKSNIKIAGVLHFDMTGYAYHNEKTMWLMNDYVNNDLNNFINLLIKTYLNQDVQYSRCGYACSDHASWTANGYPAAISAEASYEHTNPNMHKSSDTIDKLSLTHMNDYAKLAIAFAVELGEPIQHSFKEKS